MMKTTEQFKKEIEEKHSGKYIVLGDYIGGNKPIKTLYTECGHIGLPLAHSLWKGCNCGKCHGSANKSHESFVEMIENLYPNKYTFLSRYTKANERIKVKYNACGHIAEPKAAYIRQGAGCPICHRGTCITQEEFLNRFNDVFGDEYKPLDEYVNHNQKMRILHKNCGTVFERHIGNLLTHGGCNCPKCYPSSAVLLTVGVNDIHTKNPELESLLTNPEDAYTHTQHSKDKVWFTCPFCGSQIYKRLDNVTTNGLCCPYCNTNYSYGERFVSNLLLLLNIDFDYQFSPEWIKPYLYDFHFNCNNVNYIVEVDGGWHFSENNKSELKLKEVIERDNYKQIEAEKRGYVVIRIDYNYTSADYRTEYLIRSIINSELYSILGLEGYDFSEVIRRTSEPITKMVADLWNSYEEKAAQKIQEELHLSDSVVRRWLYKASELGMINETKEEIKKLNRNYGYKIFGVHNQKKVKCNETGEIFNSFKAANQKYKANIGGYFLDKNRKTSGQLPDGTRLTWSLVE